MIRTCRGRVTIVVPVVLTMYSWALHAQTATPVAAFSITKIPGIEGELLTADFTGDGILDLIANSSSPGAIPSLVLARGRGDGTFTTPQALGIAAAPLDVGLVNADTRVDVLVAMSGKVYVLPGNGNGTFATPRLVHDGAEDVNTSAVIGAFGGSAPADVAVSVDDDLLVYPGNGDFTFGVPGHTTLPQGVWLMRTARLNADALADLVAINVCCTVGILTNTGGLTFNVREIGMTTDLGDIRAADLNRDGKTDVVVSGNHPDFPAPSTVHVLLDALNNSVVTDYDTGVRGENTLAVGDFTGDGQLDIATGNLSAPRDDNFGIQMWSSVSVLEGRITNATTRAITFGNAVTFALGNVNMEGYTTSRRLIAGDFNRDGRLDLAHAPGAILLNRIPVANRAPAVFAGPARTYNREDQPVVKAEASDPDGHWLEYRWDNGRTRPWFRMGGIGGTDPGTYTFTVTVDDGQGGTASDTAYITVANTTYTVADVLRPRAGDEVRAGTPYRIEWAATDLAGPLNYFHLSYSTDGGRNFAAIVECSNLPPSARSCVWNNPGPPATRAMIRLEASYGSETWLDVSDQFRITPGTGEPLPAGWQSTDIGAVRAAGSASTFGGAFAIRGSGADIWGISDEFHYAYRQVSGDFDVVARVTGIDNVDPWTKAGLMLRNGTSPGSPHISIFATPTATKGISVQYRRTSGGASAESQRISLVVPVWLRLSRRGNVVTPSYRLYEGSEWTALTPVTMTLSNPVLVGLAVTSHVDGKVATATFEDVGVGTMPGSSGAWGSSDVGAVGARGHATFDGSTFTISGSGADIWGTADEFQFVSQTYSMDDEADFELTARVTGVQNINQWTKAGLMVRSTFGANSSHASLFVTPTKVKGVAFQRRRTNGAESVHTSGPAITAPVWLKLTVMDGHVRAYFRTATGPWTFIGEDQVSLPGPTLEFGMAVSSHVDGRLATATFDNVSFRRLARRWEDTDVGRVGVPGTTRTGDDAVTITMEGSGADIWGMADAFRFRWTDAFGPESRIAARVLSVENTNVWAKAGVMIREDFSSASSPYVMLIVSPGKGVAMQYRPAANAASANVAIVTGAAPRWVRLTRNRSTYIGEMSSNGLTWIEVGRITLMMNDSSTAGLVVTSHNNATLATAVFDDVVIDRAP